MRVECNVCSYVGTYASGVELFLLCYSVFVPLNSVMWSGVERTYIRRYVCKWSGTMPYQESFFQKKKSRPHISRKRGVDNSALNSSLY
jgi:hypothetical protein